MNSGMLKIKKINMEPEKKNEKIPKNRTNLQKRDIFGRI